MDDRAAGEAENERRSKVMADAQRFSRWGKGEREAIKAAAREAAKNAPALPPEVLEMLRVDRFPVQRSERVPTGDTGESKEPRLP